MEISEIEFLFLYCCFFFGSFNDSKKDQLCLLITNRISKHMLSKIIEVPQKRHKHLRLRWKKRSCTIRLRSLKLNSEIWSKKATLNNKHKQ